MSDIAFHEKAGRSQVHLFLFFIRKPFFSGRANTLVRRSPPTKQWSAAMSLV
jgi:hypothetical protein